MFRFVFDVQRWLGHGLSPVISLVSLNFKSIKNLSTYHQKLPTNVQIVHF